jgi:hypothetical protein
MNDAERQHEARLTSIDAAVQPEASGTHAAILRMNDAAIEDQVSNCGQERIDQNMQRLNVSLAKQKDSNMKENLFTLRIANNLLLHPLLSLKPRAAGLTPSLQL